MKHLRWLITGLALGVIGCAATEESGLLKEEFSAAEVAWSQGEGTNRISGEARIERKGETFHCGAYTALLTPDSPYARERMMRLYGSTVQGVRRADAPAMCLAPDYPAYRQTQRTSDCDDDGRFTFHHVPDGTYYVVVPVVWQYKLGESYNGGSYMKRVTVGGGSRTAISLGE